MSDSTKKVEGAGAKGSAHDASVSLIELEDQAKAIRDELDRTQLPRAIEAARAKVQRQKEHLAGAEQTLKRLLAEQAAEKKAAKAGGND